MFDSYMQHRNEGCAPRAATELVAKLYGKQDPEEIRQLQGTLERIEERDRPPGEGEPPVRVATGITSLYLQERRSGASDTRARDACTHAYGVRGEALERQLVRARREFDAELAAVAAEPHPMMEEATA